MNPSTAYAVPLPLGKGGRAPTCINVTLVGRERFAVTKIKDFDGHRMGVVTQIRDLDNTPTTYVSFRPSLDNTPSELSRNFCK